MSTGKNVQGDRLEQEVPSTTGAAITAPEPPGNDSGQANTQVPGAAVIPPVVTPSVGNEQIIEAQVSYLLSHHYILTVFSIHARESLPLLPAKTLYNRVRRKPPKLIRLSETHGMPSPFTTQSRRLYILTRNRTSYTTSLTSSIIDYQYVDKVKN
jgi:hypothetical protein